MAENILLFQIGGEVRFALQISQLFIGCTALIIIAVIVVITINIIHHHCHHYHHYHQTL